MPRSGSEKQSNDEGTWLGPVVSDLVRPRDHVLDLGCGILKPTAGKRLGRSHLCVDAFRPYLEHISHSGPTLQARLPAVLSLFLPRSYDVVLLLDVIEHLEEADAEEVLERAPDIARRLTVVYTPDGYREQDNPTAWGFAGNPLQKHLCGFTCSQLEALGYQTRIIKDGIFATHP